MSGSSREQPIRSTWNAAANLQIDHTTAQVLEALERAGVGCLLLKGPAIARWLYESGARRYVDTDLLVEPRALANAATVLARMGYTPVYDAAEMPAWWREHAVCWRGPHEETIDLHHTLPGVGVGDEELWDLLLADCDPLQVGGRDARVPSTPARALHIALHAAHSGGAERDLQLALERVEGETWEAARRLASRLHADEAFAAGLRMLPAGRALADALGLQSPHSRDVMLRAGNAPPEALTVELLARAPDLRTRIGILRHKLLPPPTYMRRWSELANRGRFGLAASYGQRLVWVLARTPRALRAWLSVRRAATPRGSAR